MVCGCNGDGSVWPLFVSQRQDMLADCMPWSANKMDSTIPRILAVVSFLPMAFKQYVNVVQAITACQMIVEGDLVDRERRAN